MTRGASVILGCLLACISVQVGKGVLTSNSNVPFIERLSVPNFLDTEKESKLSLSKSADLVIYYAEEDQWVPELSIRRDGEVHRLIAPARNKALENYELELPSPIGRQVLAVFELLLTTQVYAPSNASLKPADHAGRRGGLLIFLRVTDQGIAALVKREALHGNHGDTAMIYREICWQLSVLIGAHPDERNQLLAKLDRDSAIYAAELTNKRSRAHSRLK
jgi:hypothetical protein